MKIALKRTITLMIAAIMVFTAIPFIPGTAERVHAAGAIGTLNGKSYTSYKSLVSDLKSDYKNKSVTIEMLTNWNGAGDSEVYDNNIVIPSGCSATLNMHGFVINRNRAFRNDSDSDGECICMESSSTLTINGASTEEEKNKEHAHVMQYDSTVKNDKAKKDTTIKGATLTGGCGSWGGGGIHVKAKCTLTINDVTIAGCGSLGSGSYGGIGGGIKVVDDYSNIRLNNTTITGCFAEVDGGGIYANDEPTGIEMNNSVIQRCFAARNGGGIYTNDETVSIAGRNGSKVINCRSEKYGGGICIWYGSSSVSGLEIYGNASGISGEGAGGGVHCDSTSISLSNLYIHDNQSVRGGGVYILKDSNSIANCEITNNKATLSGGGVYVGENVDEGFSVTGKTIVRDNTGGNFYFSDNSPEDNRCNFNLTKGSDVRVSYYNTDGKNKIMVTNGSESDRIKSPNCIQFLTAENQGFHFSFNPEPNSRKIYYIRGNDPSGYEPAVKPNDPTDIAPADAIMDTGRTSSANSKVAGVVRKVGAGGDGSGQYDLIRGFSRHEETDSNENDSAVAFYYSDAFFDADPKEYNEHLATTSLVMAYAGMYIRAQEPEDANDNYYYNRHAAARQFMADIGCPDQNIYVNEYNEKQPGTDTMGVTIASKELTAGNLAGKVLVPIVTRGGGYEKEWASNATLGKARDTESRLKEAKGFSQAADQVEKEVEKYIAKYELDDEIQAGNVIFWISGYSRGGATANLTAKRLIDKYACGTEGKNNKVFAYTCEAPIGGTDTGEKTDWTDKSTQLTENQRKRYFAIHNLINAVDLVPHVAPQQMALKRYGVDHYIPGTNAGAVQSETKTTTRGGANSDSTATVYRDNEIKYIKQNNRTGLNKVTEQDKKELTTQLRAVDSGIVIDDYFHPMAMNVIPSPNMYENGDYAGNNAEDFVQDFVRFLMEGKYPGDSYHDWSAAVQNRDYFAENIQNAARSMLALVMTMDADTSAGFVGRASDIMSKIGTLSGDVSLLDIYQYVINRWHSLSKSEQNRYITFFWDKLEETGAFDFLSESDIANLEYYWPYLAQFIFTFVNADYTYYPHLTPQNPSTQRWAKGTDESFTFIPTFATFATYILQNHYPEVNLAWARKYDSYYTDETTEYATLYQKKAEDAGYKVNKPSAYIKETAAEQGEGTEQTEEQITELKEGAGKTNELTGDQKIILEVDDIVGEAVYYDLKDNSSGEYLTQNLLYRGGVDISLGSAGDKDYTLTTYAISYGVRSNEAVYNLKIKNPKHKVTVQDRPYGEKIPYLYEVGDSVTIIANPYEDEMYFKNWVIKVTKPDGGTVVNNAAAALLGEDQTSDPATFTMPEEGDIIGDTNYRYPVGYMLEITTVCEEKIASFSVTPAEDESPYYTWPVAGESLTENAWFAPGGYHPDAPGDYPIIWTYSYTDENGKTITGPASGTALNDTIYTATVIIPQDKSKGIVFSDDINDDSVGYNSLIYDYVTGKSAKRNADDGSVTVTLVFEKTESGDSHPTNKAELTKNTLDLNTGQAASDPVTYTVTHGDIITLIAPYIDSEAFVEWDLGESGIQLVDGSDIHDRTILVKVPSMGEAFETTAKYKPIVNEITAELTAPVGGQEMQTSATDGTLKVKISNEYEIDPQDVTITWTPEPRAGEGGTKVADYLTPYNATVALNIQHDDQGDYIMVKGSEDSGYTSRMNAVFVYADSPKVTMNGQPAALDRNTNSISYTFPMTKFLLYAIVHPSDISDVAHGTDAYGIRGLLPDTLTAVINNGAEVEVPVTWELSGGSHEDPQGRDQVIWTATAKVELPELIEDKNKVLDEPITVNITVNEAGAARSPKVTLPSGTYFPDRTTELITREDGGKTYYAVGESEDYTLYDGNPIEISRNDPRLVPETTIDDKGDVVETGRMMFLLKAKTVKAGLWDSAVVTYAYVFDNEIPVPDGNELIYNSREQVGVGGSEYYTIKSVSGGGEVSDGNAAATNAGEYAATLQIKDGYVWLLSDEEDSEQSGEKRTTDADQNVKFTIAQVPIERASVSGIVNKTFDGKEQTQAPVLSVTFDDVEYVLKQGTDYELSYKDNVNVGTATVIITGKGNFSGEISKAFAIAAKDSEPEPGTDPNQKGTDGTDVGPGASEASADEAITNMTTDDDPKGTVYNKLKFRSTKQTKTAITLKWSKPAKATKYVLYGNKCGVKNKMTKIATYTKNSKKLTKVAGKKIKKGTYYKFILVALDKNNNVVSTSKVVHVATKGGKVTNPKKVILKKGRKTVSKVTVKKGKTVKIKSSVTKAAKKLKLKTHRKVKYESSNKKIATVTSKGKIKGKKKGTCYIYAYAQNGVAKKLKVVVK